MAFALCGFGGVSSSTLKWAVDYRLYTPEDFAALYAIEEVCFEPPIRFDRRYMRHLINQPNAVTWISEQDGRMSGFAIVEWTQETDGIIAYIETVEVLPEWRGRGVGGELLKRVEDLARAVGACAIGLHVDAENEGVIRLYRARGYRHLDKEENYYPNGRAALVFSKALGNELTG